MGEENYNFLSSKDKQKVEVNAPIFKLIIDLILLELNTCLEKFNPKQIKIPKIRQKPIKLRNIFIKDLKEFEKSNSKENLDFIYTYFLLFSRGIILIYPINITKEHSDLNFKNLIKSYIELFANKKYSKHYFREYVMEQLSTLNKNNLEQFKKFQELCTMYVKLKNENLFLDY